jgi:hypothetical protein
MTSNPPIFGDKMSEEKKEVKAVKKVEKKDAKPKAREGYVRISADAEVRVKSKLAEKYGYTPGKKEAKEVK